MSVSLAPTAFSSSASRTAVSSGRRGVVACRANAYPKIQIETIKHIAVVAGAAAAILAPSAAQAYPRYSVQSSQPLMEVADAPNVTPKPSDPLIQREQLAETVGSKSGPSGKANFEGDATADNPNDSPRPKDRSQMGQPFAQAKSGFGQTLAAAGDQSEDQLVPFADKSNPRLD